MKIRGFIVSALLFVCFATLVKGQTKLDYKIYRADENSFHVASVLVSGEKEAVLIDAQFTKADAYRVVADIVESGKNLNSVYISHGDPDYYFGLEVIKAAFPLVTVYATEQTISHIQSTYQKKLDFWGPKLGSNGSTNVIMPQTLNGHVIRLEGNDLIIKGVDGAVPERSYVWVPALKAIVGGVNVYDNLHLWMADAATKSEREAWLGVLNEMENLHPEVVIPAHALDNSNLNKSAIAFTKNYLVAYEKQAKKANNAEELIKAMTNLYPEAKLTVALELGAKVVKGEMIW